MSQVLVIPPKKAQAIIAEYKTGSTVRDLADAFGWSSPIILRVLHDADVKMRPRGRRKGSKIIKGKTKMSEAAKAAPVKVTRKAKKKAAARKAKSKTSKRKAAPAKARANKKTKRSNSKASSRRSATRSRGAKKAPRRAARKSARKSKARVRKA
jgi:helix-turn-helix protein